MKKLKLSIILIFLGLAINTSSHAAGYGGAIQNESTQEIIFLECIDENLTSNEECLKFQLVISNEDGSSKVRTYKFNLKKQPLNEIEKELEEDLINSINFNTDNNWFTTTMVLGETAYSPIVEALGDISLGIISTAYFLTVVPIGLVADMLKSPYVAISDAVQKGSANEKSAYLLGHLLNRNTMDIIQIEHIYFRDMIDLNRYKFFK